MNKKIIYILIPILFCLTIYGIYSNLYSYSFANKYYFNKKYEKTDYEYVDTMLLGDVILLDKKSIYILKPEDYGEYRKKISKEYDIPLEIITPPGDGMRAFGYNYKNPKYNFFKKEIIADEMPTIKVISKNEIEFEGTIYHLEHDRTKMFFNGRMPLGNRLITIKW